MNATSRARIHGWLVVTSLAAVTIAPGATASQPAGPRAAAPATSTAQYLANASVLVTHGDTKAVFDPLFPNDFGQYALVPAQVERALCQEGQGRITLILSPPGPANVAIVFVSEFARSGSPNT